jgi:hypothetical protein
MIYIFSLSPITGSAVANPCHFELNFTDPMYITSLYYPEAHPPNMKCSWKINFYMYKSVKVTYLTLNIPTPNQDKVSDHSFIHSFIHLDLK